LDAYGSDTMDPVVIACKSLNQHNHNDDSYHFTL
jgi:hypothetical protein